MPGLIAIEVSNTQTLCSLDIDIENTVPHDNKVIT